MRARVYIDEPKTVIDCVRLLLCHTREKGYGRTIPHMSLKRAARILKLMVEYEPDKVTWRLAREWKDRLKLAGLDPESLEVVDEERWDLCWEQLVETWTFRDDVARRQIALGVKAKEKAGVRVRAVALPEKRRPDETSGLETPEKKEYFLGEIRKKIGGKRRSR